MNTHLVVVTETRDFVYEVQVPGAVGVEEVRRAKYAAIRIHDGIAAPADITVSMHRARPTKRSADWLSSKEGNL